MYQITLGENNKIVKTDSVFKAEYSAKKFENLYNISGSKYKGEVKDGSCFVAELKSKQGDLRYILFSCSVRFGVLIAQGIDITSDMANVIKMRRRYVTDSVTGINNRFMLEEECQSLVDAYGESLLVFRLRVANLEEYQVMFGSYFTDDVMHKVAQSVTSVFGGDSTYHITKNEFLVVKEGGDLYLNEIVKKSQLTIKPVLIIDDHAVKLDIRYGIVDFRNNGEKVSVDYDTILTASHLAVENASRLVTGKQYVLHYFTERIPTDFSQRGVINTMIKNNDFDVYFQPQLELRTGNIVCFEALTRIISDDSKVITTAEIISIAERYGGILPLGEFVYKRAIAFAKKLQDAGYEVGVSINVSTIQLLERGFINTFTNYVKKAELSPSRIHVEITESAMMYSIEDILPKLYLLIQAGIDIHLDDFGTGYSSLSYLRRIPASTVKIDKSFIDDISLSSDSETIVNNIIMVAKKLKKSVIAEGVETKQQCDILTKHGCDIVQGYYYSPAVPQDAAMLLLKDAKAGGRK